MTAIQRVKSSPMAPYMGLVREMSREDKLALVAFITETLDEPKPEPQQQVQKPYKMRPISPGIRKWRGCVSFTEEEIESDPRLKAILNR